jgi:serine/threonine-protein kinase
MAAPVIGGRYLLQQRLGGGGQGEVYQALDNNEGDVVAIKLLPQLPPGQQWAEARILRRLADSHILPIRNADVASGQPYIVTELAQHGTLEDRLNAAGACGIDIDDAVKWIREACNGVARAHDVSLVHNDVKPANLFLSANNECLVGDFGMAALVPAAGIVMPPGATPETAAPEIAAAWNTTAATASVRSDVYSLGATAFWLLAGRPAHDFGGQNDVAAKMAIVASRQPARLRDIAPHVPQGVANAIETAMTRAPQDRFATPTELARALGARRTATRRWRRTDEHAGHVACWRGEPQSGGSTYIVCVEQAQRVNQFVITSRHSASGNRIAKGCRTVAQRNLAQGIRAVMSKLG